ncbi:hypothetical protein GGF32_002657 [Allomyces javanicus]|nr:hypothetical protein GGF32_002657 [Allomyces javanicus]
MRLPPARLFAAPPATTFIRRSAWPVAPLRRRMLTSAAPVDKPHQLIHDKPKFSLLRPFASARLVYAYKRERSAAVSILKRHFRQPGIIQPGKPIDMQMSIVLQKIGFTAKVTWEYNFETVESILAFLDERSTSQVVFNVTSVLGILAGAGITWYYSHEAKKREEAKLREEAEQEEARRAEHQRRRQWDSLLDVQWSSAPDRTAGFTLPAPDQRCRDRRPLKDEIRDILQGHQVVGAAAEGAAFQASFFNVLVGPPGGGKSLVIQELFNEYVDDAITARQEGKPVPASMYYLDFRDAFKVNNMDKEFIAERFFDFLDELQRRVLVDGERISLFIDSADHFAHVFDDARLGATMRHIHETGRFVDIFLVFNTFAKYFQLIGDQPGYATQHRLLTTAYVEDRHDLLEFVGRLRCACGTSACRGLHVDDERWNVPDEVVVDLLGGQLGDYAVVQRMLTAGNKTLRDVLADMLLDSQDRVERALGVYESSPTALHAYYLKAGEAIVHDRHLALPHHLRKEFMAANHFLPADRRRMVFYYPRDRAVFEWIMHSPVYRAYLRGLRRRETELSLTSTDVNANEHIMDALLGATWHRAHGRRTSGADGWWWRWAWPWSWV